MILGCICYLRRLLDLQADDVPRQGLEADKQVVVITPFNSGQRLKLHLPLFICLFRSVTAELGRRGYFGNCQVTQVEVKGQLVFLMLVLRKDDQLLVFFIIGSNAIKIWHCIEFA